MATETWPVTLPAFFDAQNFSMQKAKAVIRTSLDAGPDKTRNRYTKAANIIQGGMLITYSERDILDNFHDTLLANGALSFNWVDPLDQVTAKVFRFVDPPSYAAAGGILMMASFQLKEIPQ